MYFFELILLGIHWGSWMFVFMSFIKFGEFPAITFSNILFAPFLSPLLLGLPRGICWSVWWCPMGPSGSIFFSSIFFFLFLQLNNFHCPMFKFTDSFLYLINLLLNPSSELFISVIVLSSSRISFWFLFVSCLLLIFSFCSHIFLTFSTSSFKFFEHL